MYRNISGMTEAQWNDAVTNAGRYVLTKAVFNGDTTLYGDGTDGAVVSIKFDEQMENANGLSMGGTIASQCKVEIRQPSTPISLVNSTFVPYVGLKDSDNREGYVPLGEFFATSADSNSNGGVVSVVGYDRFCKLEVPYEPTVSFPTTTTAIMADLAANRFTFSGTITDRPINEFRVGTVKDWIGWLAGLEGKNARFNRDGQLEFVYYDITQYDYTVDRENQYMAGVNTKTADNVTINAITSGTEENPIVSGNERSITFSNPYMTQEILDAIRNTEIVDSLTEVSGELITVDAIEAPAKSVEMNIEPYQNLNGYDHPWTGGAGKNLLPINISSQTVNGVTLTVNANGSVTVNGTASALTNFILTSSLALPDGTYVINGCPSGGGANSYRLDVNDGSIGQDTGGSATFNVSGGAGIKNVRLRIANGYTVSNLVFWPMIRIAGLSNIFEPYENICPIHPANGKNLLDVGSPQTYTHNGVTFTVNADGTVTANGTSNSSANSYITFTNSGLPDGNYIYTGNPSGSSSSKYRTMFQTRKGGTWSSWSYFNGESGNITISGVDAIAVRLIVMNGNTVSNIVWKPMIRPAEITDSAYVPYKGIGITRTGANLWDEEWELGAISGTTGQNSGSSTSIRCKNYIPVAPNTTYYMYVGTNVNNAPFFYDANKNYISRGSYIQSGTFTTPNNCYYMRIAFPASYGTTYKGDISVNYPSSVQTYQPYQGERYYPISDNHVYGGTLDVTTGLLTVTMGYVVFDGTQSASVRCTAYGSNGNYRIAYPMPNATTRYSDSEYANVISNQYPKTKYHNGALVNGQGITLRGGTTHQINIFQAQYTTYDDWNAHLSSNPLQVAYELETPVVYQLTPTQVELLKGTNNIWADGNSTLNIIYLATPRANMSFRPMELQWRGNPCVQCGDRIFVETETNSLTALVMAHTLSIEGGMNDVIKCFGSSDAEIALDKSPMEKKISAAYNALQSAIQDATALLNGTRGGIFEITKENGINTGWLIKESASPNYMGNVIIANYNGIGFSTDGGATYGTAITTDGHINGQYITAHSVDVEALSVGNTGDPFSNYVYIGRRRPNDDNTDMVIRIGVASQSMVQEMRGNRTSIYKAEDVQAYVNGSLTDAQLDARALMYYSDTDYVLLNLGSFRIGGMLMQAQANGGVKFIKAE